jgi:hypothetical protein
VTSNARPKFFSMNLIVHFFKLKLVTAILTMKNKERKKKNDSAKEKEKFNKNSKDKEKHQNDRK